MNKGSKIDTFRELDLMFFAVLAAVSELMGTGLLRTLNSDFYFSFSLALCLIAMLRWGAVGIVVGLAGGLPGIWLSEMNLWSGLLFYVIANISLGLPMLIYGNRDRDIIVENLGGLLLYILFSHLTLSVGKGAVIYFLTGEATGIIDYFGTSFFILVMNMILCCVLRTRRDLLCDMRNYFAEKEGEGYEEGRN